MNTFNKITIMAVCPYCKKKFKYKLKKWKKNPYCSITCERLAAKADRRNWEFEVVETRRKLSSRALDMALKAGEFATGTRIHNFLTGDEFYVTLTVNGDEIKYELFPQPIEE